MANKTPSVERALKLIETLNTDRIMEKSRR